jgi:small subunit ribosomal protein S3
MGQKVNPHGLRLGIIKEWDSVWYAEKEFATYLAEDDRIRKFIKRKLYQAGVSRITIQRTSERIRITVFAARPGIIIGRNGQAIVELTEDVAKLTKQKVFVDIEEIRRQELDAQLVAEAIAKDLENRVTFRRAMKQAMGRSMKMGARGIKTAVSGRLGGADIARTEHYHEGTIPLQTLRADIAYGFAEADTTYGKLGVKVWIYRGEVLPSSKDGRGERFPRERSDRPDRRERRDGGRGGRGRGPRNDGGFRGDRPSGARPPRPQGQ